ncbi:MAG: Outer membrane protein YopN [Candidatus Anoxychlamydiales bacterium]|nr:Outer membrane protein YopN [Candidatus Anoxychlamydiales bacterium]
MARITRASKSYQIQQKAAKQAKLQSMQLRQIASRRAARSLRDSGFNQVFIRKNFKTLEEQRSRRKALMKSEAADEDIEIVEAVKNSEETASRFNKKNPELKEKILLLLLNSLLEEDSVEEILKKVLEFYPDYTLADDALDFLSQTTKGKLLHKILQAREYLNANFKREIVAGRNMNLHAQIFSKEGLGSPTNLRDMYRDITKNPRSANTLFEELSSKYNYDNIKSIIRFLLHSLGSDLKSKGPSIQSAELLLLMKDTQILQAISNLYRFFKGRSALIANQFTHFGIEMPKGLDFEIIAKQFMNLLNERYVSSDKVLMLSKMLGISKELLAQIIIFTQMRDATRNTSKRLYKSNKHRLDVLDSLIEAVEEIEEEMEEEEE